MATRNEFEHYNIFGAVIKDGSPIAIDVMVQKGGDFYELTVCTPKYLTELRIHQDQIGSLPENLLVLDIIAPDEELISQLSEMSSKQLERFLTPQDS